MTRACFAPEEISDLLELAPGDPRRRHLEECPRCRASLEMYRRFLDPEPGVHAADVADARVRLDAALAREIPGYEDAAASPDRSRDRRPPFSGAGRQWFLRPIPLAAGALAVAGLLLLAGRIPFGRDETRRMRGDATDRPGAMSGAIEAFSARPGPEGSLELRWRSVPGVESYEVRLFSTDLTPRGTAFAVQDTTLVLQPRTWDAPPASGDLFYWQVTAVSPGDSPRSGIEVLRIP